MSASVLPATVPHVDVAAGTTAIEALRPFGHKVHYGDATRLDLLRAAGADKAKVIVVALPDSTSSVTVARRARSSSATPTGCCATSTGRRTPRRRSNR